MDGQLIHTTVQAVEINEDRTRFTLATDRGVFRYSGALAGILGSLTNMVGHTIFHIHRVYDNDGVGLQIATMSGSVTMRWFGDITLEKVG